MNNSIKNARFASNPAFLHYGNLLFQLHAAIATQDKERARHLREEMEEPAQELDAEELAWLDGLSGDFYMLHGEETFEPLDRTQEQLLADAQAASKRNDGNTVLALLRKASFMPKHVLAFLRSRAYEKLGFPGISLAFMLHAVNQAPNDDDYKLSLINKLYQLKQTKQAREMALALLQRDNTTMPLDGRIIAAGIIFMSTQGMPHEEGVPLAEIVIQTIQTVLKSEEANSTLSRSDMVGAYMTLGAAYGILGDRQQAIAAYDHGLRIDSRDPGLYAMRGMERGLDDPESLADFQRSVDLHSAYPIPYLVLARHALLEKEFNRCKKLCWRLIGKNENHNVRAIAYEMLALAYVGLRQPIGKIQAAFQKAEAYAPNNGMIHQNFSVFMEAVENGEDPYSITMSENPLDGKAQDIGTGHSEYVPQRKLILLETDIDTLRQTLSPALKIPAQEFAPEFIADHADRNTMAAMYRMAA